jgi:hypothetical protein
VISLRSAAHAAQGSGLDIPPCPKERGEQERLPQGGPSFGPLVWFGLVWFGWGPRLALKEKPTKRPCPRSYTNFPSTNQPTTNQPNKPNHFRHFRLYHIALIGFVSLVSIRSLLSHTNLSVLGRLSLVRFRHFSLYVLRTGWEPGLKKILLWLVPSLKNGGISRP